MTPEATVCRATTCRTCGRTTWAGCGQHVDSVMAGVPQAQRCTCDRTAPRPSTRSSSRWWSRR